MTTSTRSGIPTTHAGTNFRSRLEARWAAFFDLVGWSWTYEPFDADGYIPDFLIHGSLPFLVEVGPCISVEQYLAKAEKPLRIADNHATLIVGVSPMSGIPARGPYSEDGAIGVFVGPQAWGDTDATAALIRCGGDETQRGTCGQIGVFDTLNDFSAHPCGHHNGGHAPGPGLTVEEQNALWRRAGNDVQWRRPESVGEILQRPWR